MQIHQSVNLLKYNAENQAFQLRVLNGITIDETILLFNN